MSPHTDPGALLPVTMLVDATIKLNELLDKYWMGDNSKSNIIAICAAQLECKQALDTVARQAASHGRAGGEAETNLDIVKAHGLKTCLDEVGLQITGELYKAVEELSQASPCLLAMIGSWGDTLNDTEILSGLKNQNEMGECFAPDVSVALSPPVKTGDPQ